jgi:hypothetical protein
MNTQQRGQFAQLKVELRSAEKECIVSKPTIDARYDLIIDDGSKLTRVQIKYADGKSINSDGVVVVNFRRWAGDKRTETHNYLSSEVDAILVYIAKVDKICWLPPEVFDDKPNLYLRLEPPKNGQKTGIVMAEDYYW